MARGTRAPSQNAYRGSIGQTRRKKVLVTQPSGELVAVDTVVAIDAVADVDLVDRLYAEPVSVPTVYHDPAAEVFVLVLGEAQRHRELDERIALYAALRDEGVSIPAYVKDFGVVYGGAGLRAFLEERAETALGKSRTAADLAKLELVKAETATAKAELARAQAAARAEVEAARGELERAKAELDRQRSDLRTRVIAAAQEAAQSAAKATVAAVTASAASSSTLPQMRVGAGDESQTKPIPYSDVSVPDDADAEDILTSANQTGLLSKDDMLPVDFEGGMTNESPLMAAANGARKLPSAPPGVVDDGDDEEDDDEEMTGVATVDSVVAALPPTAIVPPGSDPLTTETRDLPADPSPDAWLVEATRATASSFAVGKGGVRLALVTTTDLARGLGGNLDIRILLYRTPDAPVVAIAIAPPAALRVPSPRQIVMLTLDIGVDADRAVLAALAKRFVLDVEIIAGGRRIRRVELTAPLADNVGYIVRAADDHLRGVAADGAPSFERAVERVLSPDFDLLGGKHADATEFRDDKLAGLDTATKLRRAISVARRFARPSREDYLVCTRGFPLPRWRELRRHVVDSAVTWGLWMGPELAQVAVSEGLARSRRDLIMRLEQGFAALKTHPTAFDLDEESAADNAAALAEEGRALGVEPRKGSASIPPPIAAAAGTPKTSEEAPVTSGSISGPIPVAVPRTTTSQPKITILQTPKAMRGAEELVDMLHSREHRLGAAIELCDRGIVSAAPQIVAAVERMSRSDAVRVLGMCVKLGEAAKVPLIEQLANKKAYIRQGAALALAMLRTEDGTQAVIDLLLGEPTDVWREIARAVGQVGPTALMPLASNFGRLGERGTPPLAERVAWAMAHVGVRGGKNAIETMSKGQSVIAPVAKKALELIALAANDQISGAPGETVKNRDVTVNRAFSRQFFEAMSQANPEAGKAALAQLDASQPMEMLDESDLIDDEASDEDVEELDAEEDEDEEDAAEAEALDESDLVH